MSAAVKFEAQIDGEQVDGWVVEDGRWRLRSSLSQKAPRIFCGNCSTRSMTLDGG